MKPSADDINFAKRLAESFHLRIHNLYRSQYGSVAYGQGGQVKVDRTRYSKGWHSSFGPACNLLGGVTVEYDSAGWLIVQPRNMNNRIMATLHCPPAQHRGDIVTSGKSGLIDGDILGRRRQIGNTTIVSRYGWDDRKRRWAYTGVAVSTDAGKTWEHGESLEEVKTEIDRKRAQARKTIVTSRRAHLIALLCAKLVVTRQDALDSGYCRAGTDGFCDRYGFSETATAAQLRQTGRIEVEKAIAAAANRVAAQPH